MEERKEVERKRVRKRGAKRKIIGIIGGERERKRKQGVFEEERGQRK